MVAMQVIIQTPFPPGVADSYIPFGWYKFGMCCWTYQGDGLQVDGYNGETEWINQQFFYTEPKYANPYAFRYWLIAGVSAMIVPFLQVKSVPPDILINGLTVNPATGKGMPLILPPPP